MKLMLVNFLLMTSFSAFAAKVWQCHSKIKEDVITLNLESNQLILAGMATPIARQWRLPNSSLGVSTGADFHMVLENSAQGATAFTLDKAKKIVFYQCKRDAIN